MARFERAYGAVICRERRYLLILNVKGHWDYPKGRPEPGETQEETTRREIREETGLTHIRFVRGFRWHMRWRLRRNGKWVEKRAVFRLARTRKRKIRLSSEHARARWVSLGQGLRLLRFPNQRALLRGAHRFLSRPQPPGSR